MVYLQLKNRELLPATKLFSFILVFFLTACSSTKVSPSKKFTSEEAVRSLRQQSSKVNTIQGKTWVHLSSPEGSASFPAEVWIDRPRKAFKLEAMDPLGSTHAILLVKDGKLLVVDYDHRKTTRVGAYWSGIPVAEIADYLAGTTNVGIEGSVGRSDSDGFSVMRSGRSDRFDIVWLEPAPQAALSRIEVQTKAGNRFEARFEGHAGESEYHLPTFVSVSDFKDLKLDLKWRNREFNQPIPIEVFREPPSLTEP